MNKQLTAEQKSFIETLCKAHRVHLPYGASDNMDMRIVSDSPVYNLNVSLCIDPFRAEHVGSYGFNASPMNALNMQRANEAMARLLHVAGAIWQYMADTK